MADYSSELSALKAELGAAQSSASSLKSDHADMASYAAGWKDAATFVAGEGAVHGVDVVSNGIVNGVANPAGLYVSAGLYAAGAAMKWIAAYMQKQAEHLKSLARDATRHLMGVYARLGLTHVKSFFNGTTPNRQKGAAPISVREEVGDVAKKIERTSIRFKDPKDVLRHSNELSKKRSFFIEQTAASMNDAETETYDEYISAPGDTKKEKAFVRAHFAKRVADNCAEASKLPPLDKHRQELITENNRLVRVVALMEMLDTAFPTLDKDQQKKAFETLQDVGNIADPTKIHGMDPSKASDLASIVNAEKSRIASILSPLIGESEANKNSPDKKDGLDR